MTATVRLTWPLAKWPTPNKRLHPMARANQVKAIRTAAALLGQQALTRTGPVTVPCEITVAFGFPDGRRRDIANFEAKHAIDGLVDAGLIADDSWREVPRMVLEHDPEPSEKGQLRVTITITEARPPDKDGPQGAATPAGLTTTSTD